MLAKAIVKRERFENAYLLLKSVKVGEGGAFGLVAMRGLIVPVSVCLGGRTCLVINKISERQLLSFIERRERL